MGLGFGREVRLCGHRRSRTLAALQLFALATGVAAVLVGVDLRVRGSQFRRILAELGPGDPRGYRTGNAAVAAYTAALACWSRRT
jgi:hypothetical protein